MSVAMRKVMFTIFDNKVWASYHIRSTPQTLKNLRHSVPVHILRLLAKQFRR